MAMATVSPRLTENIEDADERPLGPSPCFAHRFLRDVEDHVDLPVDPSE